MTSLKPEKWVAALAGKRNSSEGNVRKGRSHVPDILEFSVSLKFQGPAARGRLIAVNENVCRCSGYSRAELLGSDQGLLNSGAHSRRTYRGILRKLQEGHAWTGEFCNSSKGGRRYWLSAVIRPRRRLGKIIGYICQARDVTTQKEAELARKGALDLIGATLATASDGIIIQDSQGRVISSNPAARRILKSHFSAFTRAVAGNATWRAVREDGSKFPVSEHPAALALASRMPQDRVTMGLCGDEGSTIWISMVARPVYDQPRGTPTSVVTAVADITERKFTREVLTEAIAAIPDGFVVYDAADRLALCNDAYKALYAASGPAIRVGASFTDILRYGLGHGQYPHAGSDAQSREDWLEHRLAQHRAGSLDVMQRLEDGRWLQIKERRTPSGFSVGFRTDVSALKQETAKLRAVLENFPGGITFFDRDFNLVASNENWRQMLGVPEHVLAMPKPTLAAIVQALAERGEYGPGDPNALAASRIAVARQAELRVYQRIRPDGTVLEMRGIPLPDGGFVTTYTDVSAKYRTEQRLAESERTARRQSESLEITLANMSQGLVMFDSAGRLLVWNTRYIKLYGIDEARVEAGVSIETLLASHAPLCRFAMGSRAYVSSLRRQLNTSTYGVMDVQLRDGRTIKVAAKAIAEGGWVATHEDISESARTETLLRQKNAELAQVNMRFTAALGNMTQGLCMFDADKRLVVTNRRFQEIYELTDEDVRPGTHLSALLASHQRNGQTHEKSLEQLVEELPKGVSDIFTTVDGRTVSILRSQLPDGGWVATHEDITERRRIEQTIGHLAYHDALTGLANRTEFKRFGEQTLAHADQHKATFLTVLLIDLDLFKPVNDTFGHAAGDKLLQLVAERMREAVRATDLVARLGGDEFAILQISAEAAADGTAALARRLVKRLAAPFDIDGNTVLIGASIGVATWNGVDSVEQLMHKADLALYTVKANGRNGYRVYEEGLSLHIEEKRRLTNQLAEAIALGQLEVHYQPVVSLSDRAVCGMEALVRWRHPTRGLIPPAAFIPLAEETGLIAQIGEFVIANACHDASLWPSHVVVAINISPRHLKKKSLIDHCMQALLATKLAPDRLEFEVTENVLLQQDDDVLDELRGLRRLGASIALDDFGTGYSSLSHLRMFHFDKIKIDRSFVMDMTERCDAAAIVAAITGLARSLNIRTTAEGIETEAQVQMLQAAGCEFGQGYLFARPMPAAEVLRFMTLASQSQCA